MKKILFVASFLLLLFVVSVLPARAQETSVPITETIYGKITDIVEQEAPVGLDISILKYTVQVKEGGEDKTIESVISTLPDFLTAGYQIGDKVVVNKITTPDDVVTYNIVDYVRTTPIFVLLAIFVVVTVLVAKRKGILSLIGLVFSFIIIFKLILPSILSGNNPVLITLIAASIMIPINFYLAHGLNRKTTYAVVSTIITLILTGILSIIFVNWAKLTGFTSDEAGFLQAMTNGVINIKDLLLAAIIIGALGILDDITVSQSSIANQLKATNPKIKFEELFLRTLEVGKDHIASLVNTLILVYTSTALPLLLLFLNNNESFLETVNREVVAQEIIQTLIASIGLIAAVPISTLIAAYFISKQKHVKADDHSAHHH
ncbi:YibE/F family protein [Candidatus Dojkabacteria bacterium]|uniref:YibE/F family protein n=1 Tax=Candidatus Dojkabacteria bacterium TaxID=2099670 RepID=A0A955LAP4_9BACT|nr:YibE/F family protein [Candidatus Dojkabacteria bacterium]